MFKKHGLSLTEGFVQQGRSRSRPYSALRRSRLDAGSVLSVRERKRREERQVCEPEGQAKWRRCTVRATSAKPGNAAGGFFQHSQLNLQNPPETLPKWVRINGNHERSGDKRFE